MKLMAQGAEGKLFEVDNKIIKDRISKGYRLPEIDAKLRKQRTKKEANLLDKANRIGINVPRVLNIKDHILEMEKIEGIKVRDCLTSDVKLAEEIGKLAAKMHSADIIHGDLTTSNMINSNGKIYFIDFGLGDFSAKVEDKAVDLHLFKECVKSTHYEHWKACWEHFREGYEKENKELAKEVFARLEQVERRGRYKS